MFRNPERMHLARSRGRWYKERMNAPFDVIRTVGRAAKTLTAKVVGEVMEADLAALAEERGVKPKPLKTLRERHHRLARLIASGVNQNTAALMCDYTPSTVSILMDDPAFRELLTVYREDLHAQYLETAEAMAGMAKDGTMLIRERMEEFGKEIPLDKLIDIVKLGADRTGLGPQSISNQNVNVNVNLADRLAAARKRRAVIDITPEE